MIFMTVLGAESPDKFCSQLSYFSWLSHVELGGTPQLSFFAEVHRFCSLLKEVVSFSKVQGFAFYSSPSRE